MTLGNRLLCDGFSLLIVLQTFMSMLPDMKVVVFLSHMSKIHRRSAALFDNISRKIDKLFNIIFH